MQAEEVRAMLREWGQATVNRYCYTRSDRSVHMLEQARDMAPGTKERALRDLVSRDGTDRRRLMARAAGVPQMDIAPMWSCDPIRASNDADHPHERMEIAVDTGIPDRLMWVERAIVQLGRQYPLRGLVIRVEYTFAGSQAAKCHRAADLYGGGLTLRQYRSELAKSLEWFAGRIAA